MPKTIKEPKGKKTKKVKSTTGMGYFKYKDTGVIFSKFHFKPGKEHYTDPNYEMVDVNSLAELDAVVVVKPEKTNDQKHAELLQAEIRAMAEERLVAKGLVDANGNVL